MKKSVILFLALILVISACSNNEDNISEELDEFDTIVDYMVPSEYESLKQNIEYILNEGNIIGKDHYDELEISINNLENSGIDVSNLRSMLSEIEVGFSDNQQHDEFNDNSKDPSSRRGLLSPRGCEGEGSFKLKTSPMNLKDLDRIFPMGGMSTSHITPTDHQYWYTIESTGREDDTQNLDRFDIMAPADGFIVDIEINKQFNDYRVVIEHSCDFYTIFIHVDKFKDNIWSQIKEEDGDITQHVWPRIKVKEGEVFGTIGVGKLDFSIIDANVLLNGFQNPDFYDEIWKVHTVDTFDYYDEPIRSDLIKKNLRTALPLGGKIDYDIKGKLVGNWFLEGSDGYNLKGVQNYYNGHLSLAYDSLDPNHIVISFGDFGGYAGQFGVESGSIDPKDVDINSGLIKYILLPFDHFIGATKWDYSEFSTKIKAKNIRDPRGVALFQVISDNKIKAEFFPNKKGSEVSSFTSEAIFYER